MSENDEILREASRAIRTADALVEDLGDPLSAKNLKKRMAPSWATRIPAAIKRAKELVGPDAWYANDSSTVVVTATEAALAQALFYSNHEDNPDPALIAFTEKVESLD